MTILNDGRQFRLLAGDMKNAGTTLTVLAGRYTIYKIYKSCISGVYLVYLVYQAHRYTRYTPDIQIPIF